MSTRELIRHADADALAQAVVARLVATVVQAQRERGIAHVVLTGGGIGTAVLVALGASPALQAIDWHRVHLWWGDERFVPEGDPDRNETGARAAFIDQLDIPAAQVHEMLGSDRISTAEESAAAYADALHEAGQGAIPAFDVLMLGIGPDAHVASLFPDHPAWHEQGDVVAVHDSPKPPPTRVSMSLGTLNAARSTWVLASGTGKQEAVRSSFDAQAQPMQVPASAVHGSEQTLFLVDEDAAAMLPADFGQREG